MMSWAMVSLLTNITRVPTAVCTSPGFTPLDVIVTTRTDGGAGAGAGAGVGDGVGAGAGAGAGTGDGAAGDESPDPHAMPHTSSTPATRPETAFAPGNRPLGRRTLIATIPDDPALGALIQVTD